MTGHPAKCYGADLTQFGEFLIGASESGGSSAESGSLAHQHGGQATAVATQTKPKVDQLLVSADNGSEL